MPATDRTGFELWRQDDNGQRFLVDSFPDRAAAERRLTELTRTLHKQIYWISEPTATDGERLQQRWDSRWQEPSDEAWVPDPWLVRVAPLLPGGQALDVACGRGRNARYLAARGLAVTALDISGEALTQLDREAARCDLAIVTRRLDLEAEPQLPDGPFDLVIDLFYLHRPLIPRLQRLVRPGGVMVLRTFSSAGDFPAGSLSPEFVLRPGELYEWFDGWEILHHEEGLEASRKGGSLAGIVARRPATGAVSRAED